ncbi:MAG: diguanylate cyclase [Actinomycetota bacterium]|nr:diguanylate cyclase [Actinomycetota bacterium]
MDKNNAKGYQLKILSLEDSPLDSELIHEYLNENFDNKVQIDNTINEKEFVAALNSTQYDIILSDFNLPSFNGFAALEYAKSICPDTPFICVSGLIGEEKAVELLKNGATDYVSKDKLERLVFAIKRALKETSEKLEKKKQEAELLIANKELLFQIEEKAKRAAELIKINEELAIQNKKIYSLSICDYLTGLYNRIFFEAEKDRLDTPRQLPISIIMGDINGLKLINDAFGHLKGDELLIDVANILKNSCRSEDIVARIGGDEFAILLPQTDSQSAEIIRKRIYDACKKRSSNGSSIYPSISLGCATKNNEEEKIDIIFMAAEESMSRQKLLESRSAHSSIIGSIKTIMFEKSQETEEHADRLINLSKKLGLSMLLKNDELNELELLCTLHDIGKMSIPANILSKPGKLSDEEWIEMRKHPEVGFRIAQATSELIPIAKYILCHHERWDGKGYPQGFKGEEIPLLSRILSIVDAYDAMTNDRAYRSAMTKEEAMEEIRANAGTQFDPEISQLFLKLISG